LPWIPDGKALVYPCSLRRTATRLASLFALAPLLASVPVQAQEAQDQAAARALFEDGRKLLHAGKYAEACSTLEAASKLYASPGILLNLGDCFDKLGRTASAWTEFGAAATVASRANRNDQVAEANRRQAEVEPKLARLTVHVATSVPGLSVSRDDVNLASGVWGNALPIDPGSHTIRAEATGYASWSTTVTVNTPGKTVTVEVPTLTELPHEAPPPVASEGAASSRAELPATPPPEPPPQSHVLDWALIGGGAAVLVAGGVIGGIGYSHAKTASDSVNTTNDEVTSQNQKYDSAKTLYDVGVIGVAAGGVALVTGVVLMTVVHRPHLAPSTGSIHPRPWVSANGGGFGLAGSW
jgi:tetratricopeptide (TPR) repeat protein